MTTATTMYKPGDVVLVPFPFTNLSAVKERPALVISNSTFNRIQEDIILLAITSNPRMDKSEKHVYSLKENECKLGGLFLPSFVKTTKIITIDQRLIRKRIGRFPNQTTQIVISKIKRIIDSR